MTDTERLKVVGEAFKLACKFIRENPPGDLDRYFDHPNYINALIGGSVDDEEGLRWRACFINEAVQKLEDNKN